ncbi:MAG: hypothetical protein CBC57_03660 [Euryarchaeota archaeon TMED97]|mgnify:CR=1 FL=1|nr:MAG: hypothetical protein CBC57_03660 [Euryarchaeota archaeon TMED97]|tara:strand:- start:12242 stop:12433 length:192 start_codon:yes stop_codon:yes gene_type:complete
MKQEYKFKDIDTFYIEGDYPDFKRGYFSTSNDPVDGYNEALDKGISNIEIWVRYNNGDEMRIK